MEEATAKIETQNTASDQGLSVNDTSTDKAKSYTPSGGKYFYQGHVYQFEVLMVFLTRAYKQKIEFGLSTEVKEAGQFDDLVFRFKDDDDRMKYRFVQVKHKMDESKPITFSDLLERKQAKTKGFNLIKYFKSFCKIKENPEFSDKIKDLWLYTNISFDFKEMEKHGLTFKLMEEKDDILQDKPIGSKSPGCFQIENFPEKLFPCFEEADQTLNFTQNDIRQFLRLTRFAINQPNKNELEDIINKEVPETFHLFYNEYMMDSLYAYMWKWMTSDDVGLLTHEDLELFFEQRQNWKKIALMGVHTNNSEKSLHYGDFFLDVSEAKLWLKEKGQVLHVVSSYGTDVPFMKLVQLLKSHQAISYAATDVQYILYHRNEYISIFQNKEPFILVVEVKNLNSEHEAEFQLFLKECGSSVSEEQTLIVLSNKDVHIPSTKTVECKSCSFDDLTPQTRERQLEKEILFQDKSIKIKELLLENCFELMTEDIICSLIANSKIQVGDPLPRVVPENCYIPRQFRTQLIFDANCLTDKTEHDLLVIAQTTRDDILRLAPKEIVCNYMDVTYLNGLAKIVVVPNFWNECMAEMKKVYFNKNIHFLKNEGPFFFWLLSDGAINISNEQDIFCNVTENKMKVIAGEAGLGKTTMMIQLANKVKKSNPCYWIIHIPLREKFYLAPGDGFSDLNSVIEFIIKVLDLKTNFERKLFSHFVKKSGKMVILLDGFDEMSEGNRNKILQLLSIFLKTKVEQIWVTTRLPTQPGLLTMSGSFYVLLPFSMDDQKSFIRQLWKAKIKKCINDNFLQIYVDGLISALNESTADYLTTPMHIQMLAELYQSRVEEAYEMKDTSKGFQFKLNFKISQNAYKEPIGTVEKQLLIDFDLLELYEASSHNKYESYFQNKLKMDFISSDQKEFLYQYIEGPLTNYYGMIALSCLFPATANDFMKNFSKESLYMKDMVGIGLIRNVSGHLSFVHQTYCEYFAAYATFNMFKKTLESTGTENLVAFWKEEFLKESRDSMRQFLDLIIVKQSKVHLASLKGDLKAIEQFYEKEQKLNEDLDLFQRTPLHIAALYNRIEICKFLIFKNNSLLGAKDIFGYGAICYALASKSMPLIRYFLETGNENEGFLITLKDVCKIILNRWSTKLPTSMIISNFANEAQKSEIVGVIPYVEMFQQFCIKNIIQAIPEFFMMASNKQKWEMLSAHDYQSIRMALNNNRWDILFLMCPLDAYMKDEICSLNEWEEQFDLSVKKYFFPMLAALQSLGNDDRNRTQYLKYYPFFLKNITDIGFSDDFANNVVHKIVSLFSADNSNPFSKVNMCHYFKKLLQEKQYFHASRLISLANVKQQSNIFSEVGWKDEFTIAFETGDFISLNLLLNWISQDNSILRKLLLRAIHYETAFQNAFRQRNWQKLQLLTVCLPHEIRSMRKTLDHSECVALFEDLLNNGAFEVINTLLKFVSLDECREVFENIDFPEKLRKDIMKRQDVFIIASEEQRQAMVSEFCKIKKSKCNPWTKLLYVVIKYAKFDQPITITLNPFGI